MKTDYTLTIEKEHVTINAFNGSEVICGLRLRKTSLNGLIFEYMRCKDRLIGEKKE